MNPLIQFFNIILYQPLLNALVLLYVYLPGHDFGVAVIVLTLLIKIVLFPSSKKAIEAQRAMQNLQPKIKEIQEKFKNDKTQQSKTLFEFYKKEKISPASGCLPLLLQMPILLALYQVFAKGLQPEVLAATLYGFIPNPGNIIPNLLGIDLTESAVILTLALLAALAQFFQSFTMKTEKIRLASSKDFAGAMQSQMLYFFPVLTFFIIWKLGGIVGLYWLFSILFSIGEQYIIKVKSSKLKVKSMVQSK